MQKTVKRIFDIIFALMALVLLLPLWVVLAIWIGATSPGGIFFRQRRTGLHGREFNLLKFRSMRINDIADEAQAGTNDPRVTAVGRLLRKSSLDELPQLINVLRGDMSIIGPRPHMLKHTEDYSSLIDNYMVRHFIKPGITGWAQISGYRGSTSELEAMKNRVEHDVWYIDNWSFTLDLKIITTTVLNTFRGEINAY